MEVPWLTPPKKFRTQPSSGMIMTMIFGDSRGIKLLELLACEYLNYKRIQCQFHLLLK